MPGLLGSRRWELLPQDDAAERRIIDDCGVVPLVARTLVARGMRDPREARLFLNPSLERDWADPLAIPGMDEAAHRLDLALAREETIAVFGDFDVDGMSATCLLTLALRRLGARVFPYIPHRFGEGYGLSKEALERVMDGCSPGLVVTVDNGIAAKHEVSWLLEQGVDVVVTDHHEPAELVPEGVPVTDPKLASSCPSRELAGAGVALKLVQVLGERHGQPQLWRRYTEVATLGTISDMMPLGGENRALVADGITHMRLTERPGIVALAATAGVDLASITADALPFSLIPRLNAAGRMGTTDIAFDLLMCEDPAEAARLAGQLEQVNSERRSIESRLTDEAMGRVGESYAGQRMIVVGGEGWHEGVKGIVASRITNRYHVPSILFAISDGIARGSGRSVGSVDLFHAVEQCSDLLIRFGGHAGAVGVTCKAEHLDELRDRLEAHMEALPPEQFEDRGEVTALVNLDEMTVRNINALEALQPFGQGNKKPLFAVRGATMRSRVQVGAAGNHLRFSATDGVSNVAAIMFRTPDINRAAACDEAVDLVFEPVSETWQGHTKPKLMVKDILYRDASASEGRTLVDELLAHAEQGQEGALANSGSLSGHSIPGTGDASERSRLSGLRPDELADQLRQALIGDSPLLPAQSAALARLARARSTLCVMATGRGKSLVFHLHAAREALLAGRASIFVYPLRALVSDQASHMSDSLGAMGLNVSVLTGESSRELRDLTFKRLASGSADIVLTTPEFLSLHAERFARSGRVGFVVVDEAHHAAHPGTRMAYVDFPRVLSRLGNPVVLATSATADDEVSRQLCRLLSIDAEDVVVDTDVRDNLAVVDLRGLKDRSAALVSIVARGQKTVVYVNSREQSLSLVRMLRHSVAELAPRIAFYNAGLSRPDRLRVESAFRSGKLCCIVSTSAFGEGVNLPDIRNVVLYHLPFGFTEFNQMSGRAGRDGADARIYPLFCVDDARLNEHVLSSAAPERTFLAALYRTLRVLGGNNAAEGLCVEDQVIAQEVQRANPQLPVDEAAVSCGMAVFQELGFIRCSGLGDSRRIWVVPNPQHMQLDRSVRYMEGMRQRSEFSDFRDWVLSCSPQDMLESVNRPIVPSFGHVVDGR